LAELARDRTLLYNLFSIGSEGISGFVAPSPSGKDVNDGLSGDDRCVGSCCCRGCEGGFVNSSVDVVEGAAAGAADNPSCRDDC